MMQAIEFWFDFVSPYAYIAAQSVEQLAARYGRTVNWQPVLLGAVFRETGSGPLTMRPPVMANYFRHDFERSARFAGQSLRLPDNFPVSTHNTARVCLWLKQQAPHLTGEFVRRVTSAYFNGDVPVNDPAWLADVVSGLGLDGQSAIAACADPHWKDALRDQCETAIARGIFGAPWIVVDGESFWGNDRLPQVERWLAQGSF